MAAPTIDIGILTIRDVEFRVVLAAFSKGAGIHRGQREYTLRTADAGQRPTNFSIDYRIHAASNPKIKTATLHVKVDVTEGPYRFFRSKLGRPEPDEDETASQEDVDEILSEAVDVSVSEDDRTSET